MATIIVKGIPDTINDDQLELLRIRIRRVITDLFPEASIETTFQLLLPVPPQELKVRGMTIAEILSDEVIRDAGRSAKNYRTRILNSCANLAIYTGNDLLFFGKKQFRKRSYAGEKTVNFLTSILLTKFGVHW